MRGYGRPRAAAGRWQAQAILPGSCLPLWACSWAALKQLGASGAFPGLCGEVRAQGSALAWTAVRVQSRAPPPRVTKLHLFANSLRRTVLESECL